MEAAVSSRYGAHCSTGLKAKPHSTYRDRVTGNLEVIHEIPMKSGSDNLPVSPCPESCSCSKPRFTGTSVTWLAFQRLELLPVCRPLVSRRIAYAALSIMSNRALDSMPTGLLHKEGPRGRVQIRMPNWPLLQRAWSHDTGEGSGAVSWGRCETTDLVA